MLPSALSSPPHRATALGPLDLGLLLALLVAPVALLAPVLDDGNPGALRGLALGLHLAGLALAYLAARRRGLGPLTTVLLLAAYALHPLRLGPLLGAWGLHAAVATLGLGMALALGAGPRGRGAGWIVGLAALAVVAVPPATDLATPVERAFGARLAQLPRGIGELAFQELTAHGPGDSGGLAALGGLVVVGLAGLALAGERQRRREAWLGLGVFVVFAATAIVASDSRGSVAGHWSAPAGLGLWWALGALFGRATRAGALEIALLVWLGAGLVPASVRDRATWREDRLLAPPAPQPDRDAGRAELELAAADLAQGRLSAAERRCRRVLEQHPGDGEALERLGEIAIRRGLIPGQEASLALALTALEPATQARPTSARAWALLGEAHQRRGERSPAVAALQRSLDLDPDQPLVATRLGMAHLEGGELDAAGAAFDRAVRLAPDDADARCGRGIVAYSAGRRDEAREALEAALAIEPDHVEARTIRGRLAEEAGDDATAERDYARAVSVNPDYAEALYSLGSLHVRHERFEAARPMLERLLAQRPGHVRAQVALARVDLAAGALAEARAGLGRVLERNPEHPEARALLAELDAREGR